MCISRRNHLFSSWILNPRSRGSSPSTSGVRSLMILRSSSWISFKNKSRSFPVMKILSLDSQGTPEQTKLFYTYIIKQDSHIYVPYNLPNGWTDWAEICCGHSWVAEVCYRLKILIFFFEILLVKIFFSTGNARPFS